MKILSRSIIGLLWLVLIPWTVTLFGAELESFPVRQGPYPAERENFPAGKILRQDNANEGRRDRKLDNLPLRIMLGFLVPGLPQYLDGQWRSYGFFALEGASAAGLVFLDSRGKSRKEQYINLTIMARKNFAYPGLRNNQDELTEPMLRGYGEYYENLLKWPSSGDYDNDPSLEGVQPETDPRTYNGHQWEIAKINNYSLTSGGLPVPRGPGEEARALEAYKRFVYPSEYNWDWSGLERENERYHDLFDKSESAFRKRSTFITILLANHLLSGLDVLIAEKINSTPQLKAARLELHLELKQPQAAPGSGVYPAVTFSHRF
ncbi:MAG TPA: hypothetical protein VM123_11295 [archaeon]|nr:hypothetical protein [archaeon]